MPRTKLYYTLLVLVHDDNGMPLYWSIEFGDYSRSVVAEERKEYHSSNDVPFKCMTIIATGDKQADIQARVDELNAALK